MTTIYIKRLRKVPELFKAVIQAVQHAMPFTVQETLLEQLRFVTGVTIAGHTADFSYRRWWDFGRFSPPKIPLYPTRQLEMQLATLTFRLESRTQTEVATLHVVRGRLFEIELSFVPRGFLDARSIEVIAAETHPDFLRVLAEAVPNGSESAQRVACLSHILSKDQLQSVHTCFTPEADDIVDRYLNDVLGRFPLWLRQLLACTNGLLFDDGVIFGLREIQPMPFGKSELCVIGELTYRRKRGAIGFYREDESGRLWWISYHGGMEFGLGLTLRDSLAKIRRLP